MKSFLIDSIDKKFCCKTDPETLNHISRYLCNICSNIPLPFYTSIHNQVKYYCKSCIDSKINEPSLKLIHPSFAEMQMYESLIISCKYFESNCDKVFTLDQIEEMIFHEERCDLNPDKLDYLFDCDCVQRYN